MKEKIRKRNIKLKDEVRFIALDKDDRLNQFLSEKCVFPFCYDFCEKYISIFKLQLPIIAKSYFAIVRRAKSRYFLNFHDER